MQANQNDQRSPKILVDGTRQDSIPHHTNFNIFNFVTRYSVIYVTLHDWQDVKRCSCWTYWIFDWTIRLHLFVSELNIKP